MRSNFWSSKIDLLRWWHCGTCDRLNWFNGAGTEIEMTVHTSGSPIRSWGRNSGYCEGHPRLVHKFPGRYIADNFVSGSDSAIVEKRTNWSWMGSNIWARTIDKMKWYLGQCRRHHPPAIQVQRSFIILWGKSGSNLAPYPILQKRHEWVGSLSRMKAREHRDQLFVKVRKIL